MKSVTVGSCEPSVGCIELSGVGLGPPRMRTLVSGHQEMPHEVRSEVWSRQNSRRREFDSEHGFNGWCPYLLDWLKGDAPLVVLSIVTEISPRRW